MDAYKLTDPNLSPFINSAGAMWLASEITDLGNGTSTIGTTPYTSVGGQPLCAGTKFYNQPIGSGLACSSFFIAPDMVATANHCLTWWGWSWNNWRIILDYANASGPNSYSTYVANTKIYRPTAVVASNATDDWAVLQVTPPLEDWRRTFPLDPSGPWTPYQGEPISSSVATLGYGGGLPLKYIPNGSAWTWGTASFQTDLDVFGGNSGGPVFDTATSMTLGIAVSDYDDDYLFDPTANCLRTATYPDDHSPQNSVQSAYAQPIANLVAPAGSPIEPTWRSAKYLSEGPAAVVLTSGDEYVFGGDYYTLAYKHRDTPTSWSAWTTVPGGYTLSSQPVAVEGYNDIWLFGHYRGKLMYNHRYTNGTWSNWIPIATPAPLAQPPAAFSFDVPGANGLTTRIIVVAIVGTDGVGQTFNLTYQIQNGINTLPYMPGYIQSGSQVVPWTAGPFALVSGTPGAIAGFGTTDDGSGLMTNPTVVGGSNTLACARATLSGRPAPTRRCPSPGPAARSRSLPTSPCRARKASRCPAAPNTSSRAAWTTRTWCRPAADRPGRGAPGAHLAAQLRHAGHHQVARDLVDVHPGRQSPGRDQIGEGAPPPYGLRPRFARRPTPCSIGTCGRRARTLGPYLKEVVQRGRVDELAQEEHAPASGAEQVDHVWRNGPRTVSPTMSNSTIATSGSVVS